MNAQTSTPLSTCLKPSVAVIIPCHNEANAIARVVRDFRSALPDASIFVYDNVSSDATYEVAKSAGAIVHREFRRGKGNVVRRMFADIDADVLVMVDGDDTYDASAAPTLIEHLLNNSLDMVNAARVPSSTDAYRKGHRLGNIILTGIVSMVFGNQITDMLSGYRIFSRRFVKSFPAISNGFEIETELTVHALDLHLPVGEIPVRYKERCEGTSSKLHTYRDGILILRFIVHLIKQEKPLEFFGCVFLLLSLISLAVEIPVIVTFIETGLVPQIPSAVLGVGIGLLASLSLVCGLILETVTQGRNEAKRMHYLSLPPVTPAHNEGTGHRGAANATTGRMLNLRS
ncbi:glycosyltransferase family 2 protein [Peristeroidobacter agariperforans]|uniref:glycosyltransferase family 2 protein n=1 Tax=Peristeroidobacter agariperforans TaxID=268404 RepID=UPI00101B8600|nr:glycosyltransferase family 2 protein [Peristeroidobacter agariperforans]